MPRCIISRACWTPAKIRCFWRGGWSAWRSRISVSPIRRRWLSPMPPRMPLPSLASRMIDRTKKLPARFYVNPTGRNPVREWILELPSEDRQTVGKDIQKVEFGWPIGRPHCAPLGHGLWEVRSDLDSNRIARVIFCMGDGHMILLHGFIKKTQKTPQQD